MGTAVIDNGQRKRILGALLGSQVVAGLIPQGTPKEKVERLQRQAEEQAKVGGQVSGEMLRVLVHRRLLEENIPFKAIRRVILWSPGVIEVQFHPHLRRIP